MKELPYKLAKELKNKGFDEPCYGYYTNETNWKPAQHLIEAYIYPSNSDLLKDWCSSPNYDQVIDWFIKYHDIIIDIQPVYSNALNKYGFRPIAYFNDIAKTITSDKRRIGKLSEHVYVDRYSAYNDIMELTISTLPNRELIIS